MGTAAGLAFAHRLVELNVAASRDSQHAGFILVSDPSIPSRVDAYLDSSTSPAPAIASSLAKLSALGADFGVVICNTAHIYFDEISRQATLPLINMIGNVAGHVARAAPGLPVGLLATEATARSGLYVDHLAATSNTIVLPDQADQALVTAAIFDPEFGIKATRNAPSARALALLREVALRMRDQHGIGHVILGCTELSMAVTQTSWDGIELIDPVTLLARACLVRAGYPQPAGA